MMTVLALGLLVIALIGTPLLFVLLPRRGDIVIAYGALALWLALAAGTMSRSHLGRLVAMGCIVAFSVSGTFAAMARDDLKRWLVQVKEDRDKDEQERARAATQYSVADTMRWYEFGPETTRIVDSDQSGGYNLETGMFIPYTSLSPFDSALTDTQWQERYGVDVIADIPVNRPSSAAIGASFLVSPLPGAVQVIHGPKVDTLPQDPDDEIPPNILHAPQRVIALPATGSQLVEQFPSVPGRSQVLQEPPGFAVAGGSALDLPDYNPYANPAQLILSYLSHQSSVRNVPPRSSLEEILDISSLSPPEKGRIIMLPLHNPYATPGTFTLTVGTSVLRAGWTRYWLVRTLGGRVAILETMDMPGDKQPLKINWRFLKKIPPQQTPETVENVLQHNASGAAP